MKLSVIGAVTFGASKLQSLRLESAVRTVEWDSRLSSNTEILSVYRGKATSIRLPSLDLCLKATRFSRVFGCAVTRTAVIRSI